MEEQQRVELRQKATFSAPIHSCPCTGLDCSSTSGAAAASGETQSDPADSDHTKNGHGKAFFGGGRPDKSEAGVAKRTMLEIPQQQNPICKISRPFFCIEKERVIPIPHPFAIFRYIVSFHPAKNKSKESDFSSIWKCASKSTRYFPRRLQRETLGPHTLAPFPPDSSSLGSSK